MIQYISFLLLCIFLFSCETEVTPQIDQPQICEPYHVRCNGDQKQTCNLQGQWDMPLDCPTGYICLEEESIGKCQEKKQMPLPIQDQNMIDQKTDMMVDMDQMIPQDMSIIDDMMTVDQMIPQEMGCDVICQEILSCVSQACQNQVNPALNDLCLSACQANEITDQYLDSCSTKLSLASLWGEICQETSVDTLGNPCAPLSTCPAAVINGFNYLSTAEQRTQIGCNGFVVQSNGLDALHQLGVSIRNFNPVELYYFQHWDSGLTGNQALNVGLYQGLGQGTANQQNQYDLFENSMSSFSEVSIRNAKLSAKLDHYVIEVRADMLFNEAITLNQVSLHGDLSLDMIGFNLNQGFLTGYISKDQVDALILSLNQLCDVTSAVCGLNWNSMLPLDVTIDAQGNAQPCFLNDQNCNALSVCIAIDLRSTQIRQTIPQIPQVTCIMDNHCEMSCMDDPDCQPVVDPAQDDCAVLGLYGDGSCDICIQDDPDCNGQNACRVLEYLNDGSCDICKNNIDPDCNGQDACEINQAYGDGYCDPCPRHDPDCP
jgi:hypothetical protein